MSPTSYQTAPPRARRWPRLAPCARASQAWCAFHLTFALYRNCALDKHSSSLYLLGDEGGPAMKDIDSISFQEVAKMSDENARTTLESLRWPDGPRCPRCGGKDIVAVVGGRAGLYRCS